MRIIEAACAREHTDRGESLVMAVKVVEVVMVVVLAMMKEIY